MVKRFFYWILALALLAFGISLIAKTTLGSTAITSLILVISQGFDIDFALLNFIQNIVFVGIQMIILRKSFPKRQYLQIFVSFSLGFFIDIWGKLLPDFTALNYLQAWLVFLIGCFTIALATIYQLKADIVYNPAEGLVQTLSLSLKQDFAKVKTLMDSSLVILAIILSLSVSGKLIGVREGTILSPLIIGQMISFLQKKGTKQ